MFKMRNYFKIISKYYIWIADVLVIAEAIDGKSKDNIIITFHST